MIEKFKIENLSQKDKRALKLGAIGAAMIVVFVFASSIMDNWSQARSSLSEVEANLKRIDLSPMRLNGLKSIVPAFEMPKSQVEQSFAFRDKFDEQIKKAGLKSQPLQVSRVAKSELAGYNIVRFQYSGKCRFDQVLNLLSSLNENPYLVAIEEIEMKCDPKNRQEMDLTLVVSTFVR